MLTLLSLLTLFSCRLQSVGADLRRLSNSGQGPMLDGEAGRGPLRVWPGGLAMSRSLGDLVCDPHIVPVPHIRQVLHHGCLAVSLDEGG